MWFPSSWFQNDRIPLVAELATEQAQNHPDSLSETEGWKDNRLRRTVDLDKVIDKDYRANVRRAVGEASADAVHEGIVRMLHHRSETAHEDLYIYDMRDGSLVGSVVNARTPKRVEFTQELRVATSSAVDRGAQVVIVHNHPDSLPPSASDIRSLVSNRAQRGVIACHDGTLYVFEIIGDPVPGYTIDDDRVDRISRLWGQDEVRLFRAFEDELGVRVEHFH